MAEPRLNTNTKYSDQDFQKILQQMVNEDIKKNSKPLWLTKKFVEKPMLVITIGSIIFTILSIITLPFALNSFEQVEQTTREYLIWSNERVKVMDMQIQMEDDFQKSQGGKQIPERSQEEHIWSTNVILKCDNCNAFTKEGLQALYEFEKMVTTHKDYDKFCLASVDSSECSDDAILSPSLLVKQVLNKTPDQLTDNDVKELGDYIFSHEMIFTQVKLLFGKDFKNENRKTEHIRVYLRFGTPIKVDGKLKLDKFDDKQDQFNEFNKFAEDIIDMRDDQENLPKGMNILTYSLRQDRLEFQLTVQKDTLWALGSLVFVFIYISIHLDSFLLGYAAMAQTLNSFPITQVIFKYMLGITYFSSLHIMAIFIVMGIAADDVFVFVDAWRQTQHYTQLDKDPQTRLNQRMAITFRRASRAMLATSSTTSAAFLATGFSTIMPISSFGFYAAILIPVNFLLVILFFPAVLIVVETKFSKFKICCLKKKPQELLQEQQELENRQNQQIAGDIQQGQDMDETNLPKIEKFFALKFSPFIEQFKYFIFAIFALWMGIAIWQSSMISPISEPEKFLPDSHKLEQAKKSALYDFHQSAESDNGIVLYQFWGVKNIDNDHASNWNPDDLGKIVWDDNFDLSPERNQYFFYDYCLTLRDNELVQDKKVESFIFDFKQFAEQQSAVQRFPVPQSEFFQILKDFTETSRGKYFFNSNRIGIIKNKLRYIQIKIAAKGTAFRPYDEMNPLYELWEDLIEYANEMAPSGMDNSKQTGGFHWTWMITERAFVTNALQGMFISLIFGLIVLLATTHNIILSIFSLFSIAGIVVSVIAIMQFMGWELGIAESITIVILIGLSIDYVVHLANHYIESVYPDRQRRMKIALRDLGVSIVSGALTTAGSGFFLLFGTVLIFNKFGILILSTIFFSLIFSLFFFSSLMHAFGPENQFGSIVKCCPGRKKQQLKQQSQVSDQTQAQQQEQEQQQNQNQQQNQEQQQQNNNNNSQQLQLQDMSSFQIHSANQSQIQLQQNGESNFYRRNEQDISQLQSQNVSLNIQSQLQPQLQHEEIVENSDEENNHRISNRSNDEQSKKDLQNRDRKSSSCRAIKRSSSDSSSKSNSNEEDFEERKQQQELK